MIGLYSDPILGPGFYELINDLVAYGLSKLYCGFHCGILKLLEGH